MLAAREKGSWQPNSESTLESSRLHRRHERLRTSQRGLGASLVRRFLAKCLQRFGGARRRRIRPIYAGHARARRERFVVGLMAELPGESGAAIFVLLMQCDPIACGTSRLGASPALWVRDSSNDDGDDDGDDDEGPLEDYKSPARQHLFHASTCQGARWWIESFWEVVAIGMEDKPKTADALDEIAFLERAIKVWSIKNKFNDIEPGISNGAPSEPPASKPCPRLVHGPTALSETELGMTKQTKRLTNGIMQMVIEGAYHIRAENSNAIKFYLCPKYDGGNYDRVLLFTVLNALSGLSPMRDREAAWEALNMRTGSGPADWDVTQILYHPIRYTLLTINVDGTFNEPHYHFIPDGQTERSLWLQRGLICSRFANPHQPILKQPL